QGYKLASGCRSVPPTMHPSKKICFAPSDGFTLLELLVAVVLLSLIFLLLTSGLQFGTSVWNADEETPDTSEVLTVQDLLRRVLSEARPVMINDEASASKRVFFVGTENS